MKNIIRHTGVVCSVVGDKVRVRILQTSACSQCKAASYCHASESKEKLVDVRTPLASSYHEGDAVVVTMNVGMGFRASVYAYLFPLLLMVAALVVTLQVTHSEGWAASCSIGVLLPYYVGLYFFRNKLDREIFLAIE